MARLGVGLVAAAGVGVARAGVCEEAYVPLRTVELGNGNSVCVAPFCGDQAPRTNDFGAMTCMDCLQEPFGLDPWNYVPKTDVCPMDIGKCTDNTCCPLVGDTWYKRNFNKDYAGIGTFPHATTTHYKDDTACGGTVDDAEEYLLDKTGGLIEGLAAVPSVMFGSYPKMERAQSQQCYLNNNICYELTGDTGYTATIAIWGKCGGYAQCAGYAGAIPPEQLVFSKIVEEFSDAGIIDANRCLAGEPGNFIRAGATPSCIAITGGPESNGTNCCPGHFCQQHVDWCGSNDHPHFDVSINTLRKICEGGNNCVLTSVKPVLCPIWHPPVNPMQKNWGTRFAAGKKPEEVTQVHTPYPTHPCLLGDDSGEQPSEPEPAPEPSTPDCDSVKSATLPDIGESCATPICSVLCSANMAADCKTAADPAACVAAAVKATLGDGSCEFSTA